MTARLLLILLIISTVLAFTARFRRIGIALSVVLAVLLAWFSLNPGANSGVNSGATRNAVSASQSSRINKPLVSSIHPDRVEISEVQLSGRGAPWRLSLRVHNLTSDQIIKTVSIRLAKMDCDQASTPLSNCQLNWTGDHLLQLTLLPGATQWVAEQVWSHETPPAVKGIARDQAQVLAVQVRAVEPVSTVPDQSP